jgi:hypothetical protein
MGLFSKGPFQYLTIFLANFTIKFMTSLLKQSLSMRQIGKVGQKGTAKGPQSHPRLDSSYDEEGEETANEQDEVS